MFFANLVTSKFLLKVDSFLLLAEYKKFFKNIQISLSIFFDVKFFLRLMISAKLVYSSSHICKKYITTFIPDKSFKILFKTWLDSCELILCKAELKTIVCILIMKLSLSDYN